MSPSKVERLRAVYAEWARGNLRAGGELFADDILFEPLSDGRSVYVGREAVARQMREFLAQWSDFRIEAAELAEVGDAVVVTERQRARGSSSGIETEMTFYAVWIFREDLVARVRWESERETALELAQTPR